MRRLRHLLLALCVVLILVRPGNGCSFEEDDGSPSRLDPDKPYASFVAGKIGIVSGDLRIRHLVIAYNTLSGRGLTPAEQKAAIDVDRFYNQGDYVGWPADRRLNPDVAGWFTQFNTAEHTVEHKVPGQDYESFTNCLDDAFTHATSTLTDLRQRYGADNPAVLDWQAAQEAVFTNCSDKGRTPSPAPADAPLWLKQDRAYQIAAAQFYALDYDAALTSFRAIAADKASPWAQLSRYVAARVLIRKALVPYPSNSGTPAEAEANNARVLTGLAAARDQLQAILRDPSMSQYHAPAQHLLDYVMVRLDPAAQAEELARRLTRPPNPKSTADLDADYRQNVIDLTYAYNSLPFYSPVSRAKDAPLVTPQSPLLRWINDLSPQREASEGTTVDYLYNHKPTDQQRDALAQWRATHQPQWLAAALATAAPGSDGLADITTAARTLPTTSPAYATATYHRLRLASAASPNSYTELAALMPAIERTQPRSTINLFADLQSAVVPTLDLFLKSATRVSSISIQSEPGEGVPADNNNNANYTPPSVTLCNVNVNDPNTPHLDAQTAVIFNQRMPLHLLRDAALSPALPANIRFEIAHMAWTRALLLDDPDTARAVSPYLAQCQPAFKTWLDQYNAAKTPDERHVLGLLAMMRFTSTNPTIVPYMERVFASYNNREENWWCDDGPTPYITPAAPRSTFFFSQAIVSRDPSPKGEPGPPFLTAADRAAADRELAALEKTGNASDYFARESLAWVKAHPTDPHDADVIGFAMRVIRNACRSDASKELNHQLFDTIHRRFPNSEWAKRYTTWE